MNHTAILRAQTCIHNKFTLRHCPFEHVDPNIRSSVFPLMQDTDPIGEIGSSHRTKPLSFFKEKKISDPSTRFFPWSDQTCYIPRMDNMKASYFLVNQANYNKTYPVKNIACCSQLLNIDQMVTTCGHNHHVIQ